jgi:hypothetical protein
MFQVEDKQHKPCALRAEAHCCTPVLQAFLAQLEQQTAALAQEVSKLRLVEQQEMFLNPAEGEQLQPKIP